MVSTAIRYGGLWDSIAEPSGALGNRVLKIHTPGSVRGEEAQALCWLGEGTGAKGPEPRGSTKAKMRGLFLPIAMPMISSWRRFHSKRRKRTQDENYAGTRLAVASIAA